MVIQEQANAGVGKSPPTPKTAIGFHGPPLASDSVVSQWGQGAATLDDMNTA